VNYKIKALVIRIDHDFLVVNKPAGLLTLPDGYDPQLPHLRSVLEPHFGRLWTVHRLDRETSGVILFARNPEAHRALNTQFERHQIVKVYHALIAGNPPWDEQIINLPLRSNVGHRHRSVVDHKRGKPSITHLRVLERWRGYALIEATPKTGRTHQIRSHLASLNLPILVDPLYGDGQPLLLSAFKGNYRKGKRPERPLLSRLGLHARSLSFQNPANSELVTVYAPHPKDFASTLRQLQKHGR
jgi:RluA family pseudouridine synthase